MRHFRGHLPLWVSALIVLVGGRLLAHWGWSALPLPLPGRWFAAILLADVAFLIWQSVGTMRAARRSARRGNVAGAWGVTVLVIIAITLALNLWIDRSAAQAPPPVIAAPNSPAQVIFRTDTTLRLNGEIDWQSYRQLEAMMADTEVSALHLNSAGGLIPAARGMAKLVADAGLPTHVAETCASACTLIFLAGRPRTLGKSGRLGFHGYADQNLSGLIDIQAEQARDRSAMAAAGLDARFLDRIFDVPPTQMWFPTRADLVAAGVLTSSDE